MVRQAGPGEEAAWTIPGGRVEEGEEQVAALVREVAEETGLTVVDPGSVAFTTEAEDPSAGWSASVSTWDVAAWSGDLELRGEGQLLGTRQSGLSDLRYTRLRSDRALIERAKEAAAGLVDDAGPLEPEIERFFGDADVRA